MRLLLQGCLTAGAAPSVPGLRSPRDADRPALGALMYRAYRGTIDDEGETPAQALAEVHKTWSGAYGRFDLAASSVVERDGVLASATLITHWQERPFVAFTMTDPRFGRQGLARATLLRSLHRLQDGGAHELRLVVTWANDAARTLYESLGFRPDDTA